MTPLIGVRTWSFLFAQKREMEIKAKLLDFQMSETPTNRLGAEAHLKQSRPIQLVGVEEIDK